MAIVDLQTRGPSQFPVIDMPVRESDPNQTPTTNPLADLLNDLSKPLLNAEIEVKEAKTPSGPEWEPSRLLPRHREIMRRLLEGGTYLEIAEAMGMHPVSIGLIARTAIFRSEMAKLESEADFQVIKRAEQLSNEAIDKLKVLMRKAKSESLQKSCADSILDRAGYGKVEKKAIVSVSGEDVIRELNRRRRESGASNSIPAAGTES